MMNLINAENTEGSAYRENIAKLHGSLLNAAITTQEYIGVRQSVSFAEVAVKTQIHLNVKIIINTIMSVLGHMVKRKQ